MQGNYPDWCTGREKLCAIDKIEEECLRAVMREDVQSEIDLLEEKLTSLGELLVRLGGERRCRYDSYSR